MPAPHVAGDPDLPGWANGVDADLGRKVSRWAPATVYAIGQQVVSPGNDVVSATVAHTSAAAYATDLAKWQGSSTYGARQGFVVDVVKGYGAKVDGVTDDTAAWQAAINAVAAAGGGTITCSLPGISIIAGPLQDTAGANAQLILPAISSPDGKQVSITIATSTPPPAIMSVVGPTPMPDNHLILKSTLNAGVGGALLSGYGPAGSYQNFTMVLLTLKNVAFRMPSDPVLSGLDLSHVVAADLDGVIVDTGSYYVQGLAQPTTATSYGIRLPANNNGALTRLGTVNVVGFYNGYEWCEHATGRQIAAWGCKQATVFPFAYHATKIERLMAVHCQKNLVFTGVHYTSIDQLNIEHAASGWWATTVDVDDPSNFGHANIRWHVVLASVGVDSSFIITGGTGIRAAEVGSAAGAMRGDSFNRADSTTTLGAPWEVLQGTWGIGTNRAYAVSGGDTMAVMQSGTTDCVVQVTVAASPGTNQPGVQVRASTGLNGYLIVSGNGTSPIIIWKLVAGAYTNIATSAGNVQFVTGDVVQVVLLGASITVKRNGVVVASVVDSTFLTQTKHGLYCTNSGSIYFDNFSIT